MQDASSSNSNPSGVQGVCLVAGICRVMLNGKNWKCTWGCVKAKLMRQDIVEQMKAVNWQEIHLYGIMEI